MSTVCWTLGTCPHHRYSVWNPLDVTVDVMCGIVLFQDPQNPLDVAVDVMCGIVLFQDPQNPLDVAVDVM